MNELAPADVLLWATLIVALAGAVSAVMILGFRSHRAKAYNCYIILSIALVGVSGFRVFATGDRSDWFSAAAWANLAFGLVLGIGLMSRLMFADREPSRPSPDATMNQ